MGDKFVVRDKLLRVVLAMRYASSAITLYIAVLL